MASQAAKFKVGLFLIGGFLLFTGALIWLGASRLLVHTVTYTTYFSESVQGLDVGSPVKYRGVPLGRVSSIQVAPDGRMVEVEMALNASFRIPSGVRARLASTGITGVVFIDLGFATEEGPPPPPPKLPFPTPPHYIPSEPSLFTNFLANLEELIASLRATDLPGLTAEYRGLAADARRMLESPQLEQVLSRIAAASLSLEQASARVAALTSGERLKGLIDDAGQAVGRFKQAAERVAALTEDPRIPESLTAARDAAKDLRALAADLRTQAASLRLAARLDQAQADLGTLTREGSKTLATVREGAGKTLGDADHLVDRTGHILDQLDQAVLDTLGRIDRAATRVEGLAASLEQNPSKLLWGAPPKEDFR